MITRAKATAISFAGLCLCTVLSVAALGAEKAPVEKLPPCVADKPIPKDGCMAPEDQVTPLDSLRPAPPLTVPPGAVPPAASALPPTGDSPSVVKPPPTGDGEIIKPPPQADSKMPVIKPPANPAPRT